MQLEETTQYIFSPDKDLFISNLLGMVIDHKAHEMKAIEPHFPVLQTAKHHYALAVDCRTSFSFYRSLHFDKNDNSYIVK